MKKYINNLQASYGYTEIRRVFKPNFLSRKLF